MANRKKTSSNKKPLTLNDIDAIKTLQGIGENNPELLKKMLPLMLGEMDKDTEKELYKEFERFIMDNPDVLQAFNNISYDDDDPIDALHHAKDIMCDAYEAKTNKKALELAEIALATSIDCADAIVFIAENSRLSYPIRQILLERAVEAGKREIEYEAPFESYIGDFWGLIETRPYMRARLALAKHLWNRNKKAEAIEHELDMLRLCPNDNLGIRHALISHLTEQGRYKEADTLLKRYPEASAFMAYAKVLLIFLTKGATPAAEKALKEALEINKYLPDYLIGSKYPPNDCYYFSSGEESEAIIFMYESADAWRKHKEARDWLKKTIKKK